MLQGLECYKHIDKPDDMTAFVLQYGVLVKKIALHFKGRLPAHVEVEDLYQSGLIGLLDAQKSYKSDAGASFETYASLKIRGAIIDDLRRASGITRDMSQNMKKIAAANEQLAVQGMRPLLQDVAALLGVSVERCSKMTQEIQAYQTVSMTDVEAVNDLACADTLSPEGELLEHEHQRSLKQILMQLPEREQILLSLYYNEELNFKDIAQVLSLTEARVCQLHRACMQKLKGRLGVLN